MYGGVRHGHKFVIFANSCDKYHQDNGLTPTPDSIRRYLDIIVPQTNNQRERYFDLAVSMLCAKEHKLVGNPDMDIF